MGGRAGGGARGGGGGWLKKQQAQVKAEYAAMSEKDRYKATQNLANRLWNLSMAPKTTSHKYYMEDFLGEVQKKGGFAGDVATSVLKTMKYGNYGMISNMSQKQSWVLAKAAVQHGIEYNPVKRK